MNRDRFQGGWQQFTGKAKERWGAVTRNPLLAAEGSRQRLAGEVLEQRGISAQQSARQLEDFLNRNRHWHDLRLK